MNKYLEGQTWESGGLVQMKCNRLTVGAALGDGGLYPARLAMGGGAGYGTALEALRDGSGRCTRRGA